MGRTLLEQEEILKKIANKYSSSQVEKYKNSIFLPYITLPNAKGKGLMMEEFFEWYLNGFGIKTVLIDGNENYDFLVEDKIKVELKVASIGAKNMITFNQLHYGKTREVDKFLFAIIKPDNGIDFFVIPKEDFMEGRVKVQKQHSSSKSECARIYMSYAKVQRELGLYKIEVDRLRETLIK